MSGPARSRRRLAPRLDPELLAGDLPERLRRLDVSLRDLAGGEGAPPGFEPALFLAPGVPRVRPLLVLLSVRAAGVPDAAEGLPEQAAEHVAVAVELLHLAILLHDAALGRQGGRRRRAALRLLGGAVGWLGGNHLSLRALELARHSPAPEIVGDLLDAMREVAEGHALAHGLRDRMATIPECLAHADGHTGAVFSLACRAGGRLAAADSRVVSGLGRYGRHAGVAWHLAEDLAALDLEGEALARALEDRAVHGHPVLAISLAAERDPRVGAAWLRMQRHPDPDPDLARGLAEWVHRAGALSEGRMRLAQESWSARRALGALPPSPHREAMDRLAAALAV